jgi:hypothetical protein
MIKNAAKIVCYLFEKPKRQKNPRNVFKKSNSTRAYYTVKKEEKKFRSLLENSLTYDRKFPL